MDFSSICFVSIAPWVHASGTHLGRKSTQSRQSSWCMVSSSNERKSATSKKAIRIVNPNAAPRTEKGKVTDTDKPRERKPLVHATEEQVKLRKVLDDAALNQVGVVALKFGKGKFFRETSNVTSFVSTPAMINASGLFTVFEDSVQSNSGNLVPGSIVAVVDSMGDFIGWGLYNDRSMYRVRMLWNVSVDGEMSLDKIDLAGLIAKRIQRAMAVRQSLNLPNADTNTYRLVNGEGDRLSGLVIDSFDDHCVISSSALWVELYRDIIIAAIKKLMPQSKLSWRISTDRVIQDGMTKVVLDFIAEHKIPLDAPITSPALASTYNEFLLSDSDQLAERHGQKYLASLKTDNSDSRPSSEPIIVRENGLLFELRLDEGQKTGFYCDQRENRSLLRSMCQGKNVLDCYSYTGGFGLNGAAAGAKSVRCLDSSAAALASAQRNAELNKLDDRMEFVQADIIDYLIKALESDDEPQWDIIILDPPKLAPSKKNLERALIMYKRINRLAMQLIKPGGLLLTCSCSSAVTSTPGLLLKTTQVAAREAGRDIALLRSSGAAPCHCVHPSHQESNYLTALLLSVS